MNFQEASFPIITGFLTRSFLDSVRQHMASPSKIEISGSAVSESAKKRVSEPASHLRSYVRTFTRSHLRTFTRFHVRKCKL
jgi:hypothetical protein